MTLYKHSMMLYEHSLMLYKALQILYDALWCSMRLYKHFMMLYEHSMMLYKAIQTLYDPLWCSTMLVNGFYNALQYSKMFQSIKWSWLTRSLLGTFQEPSGNLPGISRKPSMDPLESVRKSLGIFQERLPLSVSTSGSLPGRVPGFLLVPSGIRVAMLILKLWFKRMLVSRGVIHKLRRGFV